MLAELKNLGGTVDGCVVTLGNFDGVNRAHQHLIAQAALFASNVARPLVALTFDRHPLTILNPAKAPERLSVPEEKIRLLHQAGADHVVALRVSTELLQIDAEEFVREVLVGQLRMSSIVEGPNFGFGSRRRGNNDTLRQLGERLGFAAKVVEPLEVFLDVNDLKTQFVSSTLCRRLLAEGKVRRASFCLGRPYVLTGRVVEGARRGRSMGFPTINLGNIEQLIPADGVYAGRALLNAQQVVAAAISIGTNPTFAGTSRQIEAHLLDFNGELYDQVIRLEFAKWLRPQRTFASVDELKHQIAIDVDEVRKWAAFKEFTESPWL